MDERRDPPLIVKVLLVSFAVACLAIAPIIFLAQLARGARLFD